MLAQYSGGRRNDRRRISNIRIQHDKRKVKVGSVSTVAP